MRTAPSPGTESGSWIAAAFCVVATVTALRLAVLASTPLQIFVDEAQYWLWGQRLDFGYYSKPPAIGWVIRAVTDVAGSDEPFWIRFPAPVLHGVTALILGAVGARLGGGRVGFWASALYVTLPATAVGSILISTDTIMAPFYAAALLFFLRLGDSRAATDAVLAGLFAGLAFLAKYAAIYLIPAVVLAVLMVPGSRPGWRNAGLMVAAFALVIAPNIAWNLRHELSTVEHTMDNIGWVRAGAGVHVGALLSFWGAQLGVFGPITLAGLLYALGRLAAPGPRLLALFVLPPLVFVSAQAFLDRAYANWAVAAYFPGTILVALVLSPGLRRMAFLLNTLLCTAVAMLAVLAPWPEWKGQPLAKRYLGQSEMSEQILSLAKAENAPIVASNRALLADLFYTGRNDEVAIYTPQPRGRPKNYYEQNFALPPAYRGDVLVIGAGPFYCGGEEASPVQELAGSGTWAGAALKAYRVPGKCLNETE